MVERRFQKRAGSEEVPVSGLRPVSSWNPACNPPPSSSAPLKPRRLVLLPFELTVVAAASPFLTWRRPISTTPYSVTEDCPTAAVEIHASPARIENVFMAVLWRLHSGQTFGRCARTASACLRSKASAPAGERPPPVSRWHSAAGTGP